MSKIQLRYLTQFEHTEHLMQAKASFEVEYPNVVMNLLFCETADVTYLQMA
jgi:hypothetical protein